MNGSQATSGRGAVTILEEAVSLLRSAPLSTIVVYLTGAVPFLLGLLFFLLDMTRSPFAFEHLAIGSLGVAILFIWKSIWQAMFAARLYGQLSPGSRRRVRVARLIVTQTAIQSLGLIAIPLASLLTIPFAWTFAFFRNVALFCALDSPDAVTVARRQAGLWTKQNWVLVGLAALAGVLLFANLLITIALLPQLGRSFLGIEGDFARLGERILNLSTVAVAAGLTWLVIDPLLDAAYVLRCFYGEAIATGEDLRAALRTALNATATAALTIALCAVASAPHPALAQAAQIGSQNAPATQAQLPAQAIDPARLDESIDRTIRRVEFTWRSPRPPGAEPQGRWVGWYRSLTQTIGDLWRWVGQLLRRWFQSKPDAENPKDAPVTPRMLELLIGIAVALVLAAAVFFFTRKRGPVVSAQAVPVAGVAANLADESLTADQLPEDSWLRLAEELLAKGDCRLSLRALYLAGLNYLGARGMVSIRRWKSGLDYRRELERRARAHPGLAPLFTRNVAIFERGWYGRHSVDRGMVEDFTAGLKEIKSAIEGDVSSYAER